MRATGEAGRRPGARSAANRPRASQWERTRILGVLRTVAEVEMAANFMCFLVGAVAPLSLVSWLIAFH
jgi:hypothetical protein